MSKLTQIRAALDMNMLEDAFDPDTLSLQVRTQSVAITHLKAALEKVK